MAEPEDIEESKIELESDLELDPIDDPMEAQAIEDIIVDQTGDDTLELRASKTVPLVDKVDEPLSIEEDTADFARLEWKKSLAAVLRESDPSLTDDQVAALVDKEASSIKSVGDPSGGLMNARLLQDAPSAYMYQVAEAAEMALMESEETVFDGIKGFLSAPSPEVLTTAEQLVQDRVIDEEGQYVMTPFSKERRSVDLPGESIDFTVTPEAVDVGTSVAGGFLGYKGVKKGAKVGAAIGGKLGTPGKVIGAGIGGTIGGMGGFVMAKMGTNVLATERLDYQGGPEQDFLDLRQGTEALFDFAKALNSSAGVLHDLSDWFEVASAEARSAFIARSIAAADAFGVSEKAGKSKAVTDFIEHTKMVSKGEVVPVLSGPFALASILSHPYVGDAIREQMERRGLTEAETFAAEVFLPIPEEGEKTIHQYMADVVLAVHEELEASEEFRQAKSLFRQQEIEDLDRQLSKERRTREPEYRDWPIIQYFEDIDLGVHSPSDKEIKLYVKDKIDSLSYNDLPPDLKGKQPDVDKFTEFVKLDLSMGGLERHGNPKLDSVIEAIQKDDNKKVVQKLLNTLPIGFIDQLRSSNNVGIYRKPSDVAVAKWARSTIKYLEEKVGRKMTRPVQRNLHPQLLSKGSSMHYSPSWFGEMLQWAVVLPTTVAEQDIAIDFRDYPESLLPIIQKLGLPVVLGTPAGVDFAAGDGIRNPLSTAEERIRARRKTTTGGFQVGYEEIMLARGYARGSWQFNLAQNIGLIMDMVPQEKWAGSAVANVGRLGVNVRPAAKVFMATKAFKATQPGIRAGLTKRRLLQNTVFEKAEDPTVEAHKLWKKAAQTELNEGLNPLDRLDAAQRERFADVFVDTLRNPEQIFSAFEQAARVTKKARRTSQKIIQSVGTNDIIVLKNSAEYQSVLSDLNGLVQAGRLKADEAARIMAHVEAQAIRVADAIDTPYGSAREVLGGLRVTANRPAGTGAGVVVRLVEDGDSSAPRRQGVPLGYFEYDQRTHKAVINLFQGGDLNTLWQNDGHFMATLMGREFTDKLIRYFDNELTPDGTRRLTDTGNTQFAEAWMHYRRVRDNPNGFVRRLMGELWTSLHNLWSRLRKKPGLLPREVRQYWDLEFGELPKDRRLVQAISGASLGKGSKYTKLAATQEERILRSPDADKARKRVATDLGYDAETMHALLGDRKQTRVTVVRDATTGQSKRVVERNYAPREYDAIDAGLEVFALLKTADFRKSLSKSKLVPIGSGRYHVPASILKTVMDKVAGRFVDALGVDPAAIAKRIYQPDRSGVNALASRNTLPSGVTAGDVIAFRERFKARYIESNEQINQRVRETDFIVLDERPRAGLKTLIQEISDQPEADMIPFSLLDPDANLKLISVEEYTTIRNVLTDITATPLNRRNRNMADPGYLMSMSRFFANRKLTEAIGEIFKDISDLTRKKKDIPETSADPHFVNILEGYGRMVMDSHKAIIRLANDPDLKAIDTVFGFFEHNLSLHTPRVSLSNVRSLFSIVGLLDGSIRRMEAKAAARVAGEVEAGKPITATYDPLDIDAPAGGGVTLRQIGRNLSMIQDLLGDQYGMTALERESLTRLRMFNDRLNAGDARKLTQAERSAVADSIQVIYEGLREKQQYVENFSTRVFEIVLAIKKSSQFDLTVPNKIDIYNKFYTGDIAGILDIDTAKKIRPLPGAQTKPRTIFADKRFPAISKAINSSLQVADKLMGTRYSTKTPDLNQNLISLMVMLKLDDIQFGLARELAEEGYDLSRRSITNNLDLKGEININRSKYIDRVVLYIDRALGKADEVSGFKDPQKGRKIRVPQKPPKEMYGPTEEPKTSGRQDHGVITRLDQEAQHEADRILQRAGIRIDEGSAEVVMIGGKEFVLPKNMVDQLESWVQKTYPSAIFKKHWGRKGRAEYRFESKDPVSQVSERITEHVKGVARDVMRVGEFIVSPRTFYTGLLIGTGGLPMVGYGIGVFIGGLSQVHLGHGALAAARDLVEAPAVGARLASEVTPIVRGLTEAADAEVPFVSGVLARLFGEGAHRPRTKPLVLDDGRIFTADMIAASVGRHGWKSAFADVLANNNLMDAMHDRFNKSNSSWATGAMFSLAGLPLGPQSALISGAFGASVSWAVKPGNIFSKFHRFYRETFVSFDTYLRIKVLVRELKKGADLDYAAKKTRSIMLDYSDLSETEVSYFKKWFAFYTYFSQANKLLFTSIMENPDRVITQLKLTRASQLKVTESKDPDLMLSPWDKYRTFLPFEILGQKFRLPFLLPGDSIGLIIEMLTSVLGNDDAAKEARVAFFGRLSPQIGLAAAITFDVDPGLGFPLERATLQVPAELIEFDLQVTGGALRDFLQVEYIEPKNIRFIWDEKEKRRINEKNIEMPGRGIYVAKNTGGYLFVMNYLQSPLTGRMGDNMWALSRANAGIVETGMDGIKALKNALGGQPILSHVGALQTLGLVKGDPGRGSVHDGVFIPAISPWEPGLAKLGSQLAIQRAGQLTTAPPAVLKKYGVAYKSADGTTYNVYADQFYPTEIGRTIGLSAAPEMDYNRSAGWKYRQYIKEAAEKDRVNKASKAEAARTKPIDDEQ